jgi:hypothetical protein
MRKLLSFIAILAFSGFSSVGFATPICNGILVAITGKVPLLPGIKTDESFHKKVAEIRDSSAPDSTKVTSIWELYREERQAQLPAEIRELAKHLEIVKLTAAETHMFDPEEMGNSIPSPLEALQLKAQADQIMRETSGKIVVQIELAANPVAAVFESAQSLEFKIQLESSRNEQGIFMTISDFINPWPAGVLAMKRVRMRSYSAEWQMMQLLGKALVTSAIEPLRRKKFANSSLDDQRARLVRNVDHTFAMSQEDYLIARWKQDRIIQCFVGYICPKGATAIVSAVTALSLPF